MKTDREEVRRIAALARLRLDEDHLDTLVPQFQDILDYVAHLAELPTEGVAPLFSVAEASEGGRTREDQARSSLNPSDALANAAETREGHFSVPRVIDPE